MNYICLTARIFNKVNGATAGAAILFSERYLLTCSHVVLLSLGLKLNTQEKPEDLIELEFPCLDAIDKNDRFLRRYKAKVIIWYPTVSKIRDLKDIVVLELVNDNPKVVDRYIKLKAVNISSLIGRSVSAFGFPAGNNDGELAKGKIRGVTSNGLIQIDGETITGSRIQPGFSGTAIIDDKSQLLLGIAKRENARNPDSKVALMIPTSLLLRAWKPLEEYCEDDRIKELFDILRLEKSKEISINDLLDGLYNRILREKSDLKQLKDNDILLKDLEKRLFSLSQYSRDEYTELERFAIDLREIVCKLEPESRLAKKLDVWQKKYIDIKRNLWMTQNQRNSQNKVDIADGFIEVLNENKLLESSKTSEQKKELKTKILLEMAYIPAGNFVIGAPISDENSQDNERPQHAVSVSAFYIGRFPVTQEQWQEVASWNQVERKLDLLPSYFKGRSSKPVEKISWYDAKEFCARLSKKTGKEYRLPIEAEWEYACRSVDDFHTSLSSEFLSKQEEISFIQEWNEKFYQPYGYSNKDLKAIHCCSTSTVEVGGFPINNFGLYDMHGNLWEWCLDNWSESYREYSLNSQLLRNTSRQKVCRGGSWYSTFEACRSASRRYCNRDAKFGDIGFRVVCVLQKES
ncbi:Sulphatase-modifying factor protein [[Leptolyngbya] sp. PCC 7376]|nr:Sulphatase-modifying factor protein [[Leptolyngbya] sp. PCC 7376]